MLTISFMVLSLVTAPSWGTDFSCQDYLTSIRQITRRTRQTEVLSRLSAGNPADQAAIIQRSLQAVVEDSSLLRARLFTAERLGNPPMHYDRIIVGGGLHGTLAAMNTDPRLSVLVIDAHASPAESFRQFGQTFRINSPELEEATANHFPGSPVQVKMLSSERFVTAETLGNAALLNFYVSAAQGLFRTKVKAGGIRPKDPLDPESVILVDLDMGATVSADRVFLVTGLGAPKTVFNDPATLQLVREEMGKVPSSPQMIQDIQIFDHAYVRIREAMDRFGMKITVPYEGLDVALIGAGDAANVFVEGAGRNARTISWFRQKAKTAEDFIRQNKERYGDTVGALYRKKSFIDPIEDYATTIEAVQVDGERKYKVSTGLGAGRSESRVVDKVLIATGYENGVMDLLADRSRLTLADVRGSVKGMDGFPVLAQRVGYPGGTEPRIYIAGTAAGSIATKEELAATITKNSASLNVLGPRTAALSQGTSTADLTVNGQSASEYLRGLTYEARTKWLAVISQYKGFTRPVNEMYAKFLNASIEGDLIAEEDVRALLQSREDLRMLIFDQSKNRVAVMDEATREKISGAMIDRLLVKWNTPESIRADLRQKMVQREYWPIEWEFVDQAMAVGPVTAEQVRTFEYFLSFADSLSLNSRKQALRSASNAIQGHPTGKELSSYQELRRKTEAYEEREFRRLKKEIRSEDGSSGEAERVAHERAAEKARVYGDLRNACRSRKPSPAQKVAAARYTKFTLSLATGITAATYYHNHRDEKIDRRWAGKFTYELAYNVMVQYIYSRILTNPLGGFSERFLRAYPLVFTVNIPFTGVYELMFGVKQSDAEKKVAEMRNTPEGRAALEEFERELREYGLFEKLESQLMALLPAESFTSAEREEFRLREIPFEVLDQEPIQDALIEQMVEKLYYDRGGEWQEKGYMPRLGRVAYDRFAWSRTFDVFSVARNIFVQGLIYRVLCLEQSNPAMAVTQALGIYVVDRTLGEYLSQSLRKKAVNQ